MSDSDVEVHFGGDASGALASMSEIRHALMGLTNPIRGVYDNLGELAEAFAAAFAVEKVAEFVEKFAEAGEQIERTAAMIGVSTKSVQELSYMSAITGGSAEGLANSIQRLELGLAHAQNPTSQQAQALRALGLSAQELIDLPVDKQMDKLADAFARFADSGNKTAVALALGGRSFAQMIPIFDKGSEGLEEYRQHLADVGELMPQQVEALSGIAHSITDVKQAFSAFGGSIVAELAPAFEGLLKIITDVVAEMTHSIQQGGIMKGVLDLIAATVTEVDMAFAVAIGAVNAFWDVAKTAAEDIATIWSGVGRIMYDAFTFKWSDISAAWTSFEKDMEAHGAELVNNLTGDVKQAVGEIKTALGVGGGEGSKTGTAQMPALDVNTSQETSAAQKALDSQIKVLQEGLAAKKALWDGEVKSFQMGQEQETKLLIQATQQEYEAEMALYQKELAIGNLTVSQRAAINAKIQQLEAQHGAQMVKLDEQSIQETEKQWNGYFKTLEGEFNSNLRSLLSGQETWGEAMKKILGDLIIKFIEGEEQKLAQHLATEIAMTTATQSGAAARLAAENTSNSGGILVAIANAIKSIMTSAGETSAAVSAETAPVAGPAAPALGAAAGATVMAQSLALVPHAVGSWEVPNVTPALLHPGEMVIPQTFAEGLRNVLSGGGSGAAGGNISVTLQAWDGASVNSWLKNGGATLLTKHITNTLNNNPSLRPSYAQ